jgi:DNA-binding protein HU-beta
MTKTQLIAALADKLKMTKADADTFVNGLADLIMEELAKGNKITWTGFGTFEVRSTQPRKGRNPQTGETMMIPATRRAAFKAGKTLKDAVRN